MDLISVSTGTDGGVAVGVRSHRWSSDLSMHEGGADRGPSPSELLAGSLGACICLMVEAYCRRHGYEDGSVAASMTYEMGSDPARIAAIVVDLEVPRDVPEERRAAIRRIAEACPIHATLGHAVRIDLEIL